jgi:hypothetical protein
MSKFESKNSKYHISCGYHRSPYQTSAMVSMLFPRISLDLVPQLFREMAEKLLELKVYPGQISHAIPPI